MFKKNIISHSLLINLINLWIDSYIIAHLNSLSNVSVIMVYGAFICGINQL